jgi:L-alanine-DL-glutamate epimerase-like enolase superfamily enzyme
MYQGLGESAALPPVTSEDQPDILEAIKAQKETLEGLSFNSPDLPELLDNLHLKPTTRAGIEVAILDTLAKTKGLPLYRYLGAQGQPCPLQTDITLPIANSQELGPLALEYQQRGFKALKIKVGKYLEEDINVLETIGRLTPTMKIRLDANEGYSAEDALKLLAAAKKRGLDVECFEQPCHREDIEGMQKVAQESGTKIVADESCQSLSDLETIAKRKVAQGVNLKLMKFGGILETLRIGRRARSLHLNLMAGAMVETRLGLTAMAHTVTALGGVEWLDLDTNFLLQEDPFTGGYTTHGAELRLHKKPGLGIRSK